MKGRTTCPKCDHEFILDTPKDKDQSVAICPKCNCKFNIKKTSDEQKTEDDCTWEEHGEPRKTILSSIKPRTDKPMIVAVLLFCVFGLGISSAVFSEAFIETPLELLSNFGITGDAEIIVTNELKNPYENVTIIINGFQAKTNIDGKYIINNISLGIIELNIILSENNTIKREILIIPFINSYNEIIIEENSKEHIPYDTIGCSIILVIFSIIALLGGISAFTRKNFDVAIVGSILGIFSFGFFMIGSLLSVIAFFIILKCKEEFENEKKGKNF